MEITSRPQKTAQRLIPRALPPRDIRLTRDVEGVDDVGVEPERLAELDVHAHRGSLAHASDELSLERNAVLADAAIGGGGGKEKGAGVD